MKLIRTEDAVGTVLAHDITQIIKDVKKISVFRKGHIVEEKDIPVLLSVGKEHLYVWEDEPNMLHENDAAEYLCRMAKGENLSRSEAKEGKIELSAECDGLFKIKRKGLVAVNSFGRMMIATRKGDEAVSKGDKVAGTRIIPLVIEKDVMEKAEKACFDATGGEPILSVLPFRKKKVGICTTGSEVFKGRIKDTFTPVIKEKIGAFPSEFIAHEILDDDAESITKAIMKMADDGADLVVCTGGMSVDPDDRTPLAIRNTGARIVSYGAPVLPGAMFLLAYLDREDGRRVTILGLPGCVMYCRKTIFDIVLPRVMADDEITAEELSLLGEGGLL